jgi:hypothetical protein
MITIWRAGARGQSSFMMGGNGFARAWAGIRFVVTVPSVTRLPLHSGESAAADRATSSVIFDKARTGGRID